jgi:hypothetical protein
MNNDQHDEKILKAIKIDSDKHIALIAVEKNSEIFQYASYELRSDKELALMCYK